MIGDLLILWEEVRREARDCGHEEGYDMREFLFWAWAWAGLAVGVLGLVKLWQGVDALCQIAEKL